MEFVIDKRQFATTDLELAKDWLASLGLNDLQA